jgi:hypothetical protein
VLARIIEPVSKADSARVLEEAGVASASYPTVNRRLRVYARDPWRQRLSAACARHAGLGPASLVLYDVSTLYFETDEGRRVPGERSVRSSWSRSRGRVLVAPWERSRGLSPQPGRVGSQVDEKRADGATGRTPGAVRS